MNESDSIPPPETKTSLLAYSTWLVIGIWLLATGGELIFRSFSGDNSTINGLFGVLRIVIGLNSFRWARMMAFWASQPQYLQIRALTVFLLIAIIGFPLLVFVFQTLLIALGMYEPNELYQQNVYRVLGVAVGYLLATIFAGWKLKE